MLFLKTGYLYEELDNHYPIIGYEQWNNSNFKNEFLKVDIGIYYLRSGATLCSENQLMWACLKSYTKCIQLRQDNNVENSYLTFQTCPDRKT